jgi:hypothetical protein
VLGDVELLVAELLVVELAVVDVLLDAVEEEDRLAGGCARMRRSAVKGRKERSERERTVLGEDLLGVLDLVLGCEGRSASAETNRRRGRGRNAPTSAYKLR